MSLGAGRAPSLILVGGLALLLALIPATQVAIPRPLKARHVSTIEVGLRGGGRLLRHSEQGGRTASLSADASLPGDAGFPLLVVFLLTAALGLAGPHLRGRIRKQGKNNIEQSIEGDPQFAEFAPRAVGAVAASLATTALMAPGITRGSGRGDQTLSRTAPFGGCGGDWRRRPLRPALGGSVRRSLQYRRRSGSHRCRVSRPGPSEFSLPAIAFQRWADIRDMAPRHRLGRSDHTLVISNCGRKARTDPRCGKSGRCRLR